MPIPALIPLIVGSIIESAAEQASLPVPIQSSGPVVGVMRTIPADSLAGEMTASAVGAVQINGQLMALSPAAQIRNEANMIVMPNAVAETVRVRYLVDAMGMVSRVWILTPNELAAFESR